MKTLFYTLMVILATFIISCDDVKTESLQDEKETPDFLKYYKWTTLPIQMKGCGTGGLPLLNADSLNADMQDGSLPYCTFKTNGNYYAVIRLGLADCSLPYLITYDKSGKIIDEKELAIGYCGSGPGFHCEEFASIGEDFTLYTSDTISVSALDSLGEEIKSATERYIIYKKGKLLNTGKIELTDTIRKKL